MNGGGRSRLGHAREQLPGQGAPILLMRSVLGLRCNGRGENLVKLQPGKTESVCQAASQMQGEPLLDPGQGCRQGVAATGKGIEPAQACRYGRLRETKATEQKLKAALVAEGGPVGGRQQRQRRAVQAGFKGQQNVGSRRRIERQLEETSA